MISKVLANHTVLNHQPSQKPQSPYINPKFQTPPPQIQQQNQHVNGHIRYASNVDKYMKTLPDEHVKRQQQSLAREYQPNVVQNQYIKTSPDQPSSKQYQPGKDQLYYNAKQNLSPNPPQQKQNNIYYNNYTEENQQGQRINLITNTPYQFKTNESPRKIRGDNLQNSVEKDNQQWNQIDNTNLQGNNYYQDAALLPDYSSAYMKNKEQLQQLQQQQQQNIQKQQYQQQPPQQQISLVTTVSNQTYKIDKYKNDISKIASPQSYQVPVNKINLQPQQQNGNISENSIINNNSNIINNNSNIINNNNNIIANNSNLVAPTSQNHIKLVENSYVEQVKRAHPPTQQQQQQQQQQQLPSSYLPSKLRNSQNKDINVKKEILKSSSAYSIKPNNVVLFQQPQQQQQQIPQDVKQSIQNIVKVQTQTPQPQQPISNIGNDGNINYRLVSPPSQSNGKPVENYGFRLKSQPVPDPVQNEGPKRHEYLRTEESPQPPENPTSKFYLKTESGHLQYRQEYKDLLEKYSPKPANQQDKPFFRQDYVPSNQTPINNNNKPQQQQQQQGQKLRSSNHNIAQINLAPYQPKAKYEHKPQTSNIRQSTSSHNQNNYQHQVIPPPQNNNNSNGIKTSVVTIQQQNNIRTSQKSKELNLQPYQQQANKVILETYQNQNNSKNHYQESPLPSNYRIMPNQPQAPPQPQLQQQQAQAMPQGILKRDQQTTSPNNKNVQILTSTFKSSMDSSLGNSKGSELDPNSPLYKAELQFLMKDEVRFARMPRTEKTMKLLDRKKARSLPKNAFIDKSKFQVILGNFGYNYKDFLGQGSFGTVYKGQNLQTGQEIAIKQMDNNMFVNQQAKEGLKKEIEVMKELQSANVVRMYDVILDKHHTNIILELCQDGDLEGLLEKKHKLPEEEATQILFQILQGFKDLLGHGYIHRDIKPANTLIKGEYFKLADFGFATKVDVRGRNMLREFVGSPLYMAPQLLENKPYTVKSDIWSIGLMFYEMLFGKTPWPARDIKSLKENVKKMPLRFPYDIPIGRHTKSFIEGCLQKEEEKRFDWKELFDHPIFFQSGEIDHAQALDPRSREIIHEIQREVQLRNLHIEDLFSKFDDEHDGTLTELEFYNMLHNIDRKVTSYEARHIFELFDEVHPQTGQRFLNLSGFRRLFTEYDFSDVNNKAVSILNDIREIIKHNKINVFNLFDECDIEHKGDLTLEQFTVAVKKIVPKLKLQEVKLLFDNFDDDKNGTVSFNEFYEHMSYGIQHLHDSYDPYIIKAKKLLKQTKEKILQKHMTIREFFDLFDEDENQSLDMVEFTELMKYIDEKLPKADIQAVYNYVDVNKDGSIQLQEFLNAIE